MSQKIQEASSCVCGLCRLSAQILHSVLFEIWHISKYQDHLLMSVFFSAFKISLEAACFKIAKEQFVSVDCLAFLLKYYTQYFLGYGIYQKPSMNRQMFVGLSSFKRRLHIPEQHSCVLMCLWTVSPLCSNTTPSFSCCGIHQNYLNTIPCLSVSLPSNQNPLQNVHA